MAYRLDFSHRQSYAKQKAITIPITLISGVTTYVDFSAKIDTGSTFCVFEKNYADWLELDLKSGVPVTIATATGSFQAYGHELTLVVFDMQWQAIVYFAGDEFFYLNVLGRNGFLKRLRIGILDYEELIYLARYE